MAATYPVFIKHDFIGKSTQAQPRTSWAHSRYINRQSAAQLAIRHLIPDNFVERRAFFYEHEEKLRKNGRVIDKLTLAVPHDVDMHDFAAGLERLGLSLGQEKCPFEIVIHGFGTSNHHAHIIFIDRDVETGKRVFGTTDRNSTQRIKLEWERVANEMFEELGYEIRVKVKDWSEEQANDNQLETPAEPDNLPQPEEPESEPDDTVSEEPVSETAFVAVGEHFEKQPPHVKIQHLHNCITEVNRINDAVTRLQEARDRYATLYRQRENAQLEASTYSISASAIYQSKYAAEERLSHHQRSNGKLKGLGVKLFGYEIKTQSRREAEKAQREYEARAFAAEHADKKQAEYNHRVSVLSAEATAAEREAFMRQQELEATYGTDKDIENAKNALENSVRQVTQSVTVDEAAEALFQDQITPEEFKTYLEASGQEAVLEAYKDVMEEPEQDL